MNMDEIKSKAKKVAREFGLVKVGIIIIGILLIIFPTESQELICRTLAAALMVWGIFRIAEYIRFHRGEIFGSFSLVQGGALLIFGTCIMIHPEMLTAFLTAALSIILFIGGILKLQYALEFSRMNSKGWRIQAVGAILMISAGVIAFVNPFSAANILMVFLGICLIADGVWDLATMAYMSKYLKGFKKSFNEVRKTDNKKINSPQYVDTDAVDEN